MCLVSRSLSMSFSEINEKMSLAEFFTHIVYELRNPLVDKLVASYTGFYEIENKKLEEKIDKNYKSLDVIIKEQKNNKIFKKKNKNNEKIRI